MRKRKAGSSFSSNRVTEGGSDGKTHTLVRTTLPASGDISVNITRDGEEHHHVSCRVAVSRRIEKGRRETKFNDDDDNLFHFESVCDAMSVTSDSLSIPHPCLISASLPAPLQT